VGEEGVDAAEVEVDVLQGQHQQPQVREDLRAAASMHHRSMMMCVWVSQCCQTLGERSIQHRIHHVNCAEKSLGRTSDQALSMAKKKKPPEK